MDMGFTHSYSVKLTHTTPTIQGFLVCLQICATLATSQSIFTVSVTGFAVTGDGKGHLWYVSVELEGMCDPFWMWATPSTGLLIKENQRGGESQSHANIPLLGPVGRVLSLSTMLSSLCWTNPSKTVSLNKPFFPLSNDFSKAFCYSNTLMNVQRSEIYSICITQEENVFLYPSLTIFPLPIFST